MFSKEEAKQLRKDFWDAFGRYSKRLPHLKKQNKKWITYNTGIKHLELKFVAERKRTGVMLELNHRSESRRLDLYEQLEKYKPIIDEQYGEELTWNYLYTTETGKEVCRIYTEREDLDFHRREQWPKIFNYLSEHMIKLELAFLEVKDFIQAPETM